MHTQIHRSNPLALLFTLTLLLPAACDEPSLEADGGTADAGDDLVDAGTPATEDAGTASDGGEEVLDLPWIHVYVPGPGGELVEVAPPNAFVYGTPFHPVITGMTPGETIEIEAQSYGYRAWATFVADEDGHVDTAEVAPIAGTYEGVDPDGLTWSMRYEGPPEDPTHFNVYYTVTRESGEKLTRTHRRVPMVGEYIDVERTYGDGFVAETYRNDWTGTAYEDVPQPVVLVLGGSGGGLPTFTAAWFPAAYGWASAAVGYFKVGALSLELEEIEVEAVGRAIELLKAEPWVDPEHIVLWGGSRGSELALLAGGLFADDVAGVIVEAPSGLVWASVNDPDVAAWTIGGEDVPFVPSDPTAVPEEVEGPNGSTAYAFTSMFLADMAYADESELDAATIPVEDIQGPVLLLGGADDLLWPSCTLAEVAMSRLESSGHATMFADRSVCLPEAGHYLGPPGWSTIDSGFSSLGGYTLALGGTPGGTGRAQRQVYLEIDAFLDGIIAGD